MGNTLSQSFPPPATFTQSSLPSLSGRVYLITGASAGIGKHLASLLYSAHATVYLGARNSQKAADAISWIKSSHPSSTGALHFLPLDLNDLAGIKGSVEEFLKKEKRLDVLFNNAGVMVPPAGSVTAQGHDLQLGTNCIAPFLLTKLLTPILVQTAQNSPKGGVRVVWVSSGAAQFSAPRGGVEVERLGDKMGAQKMYAVSKGGNILQALEMGRRFEGEGVVSVALNPGNLRSELQRHIHPILDKVLGLILYPAVNGAYTELFAGLSPEVPDMPKGSWVVPFGRVMKLRKDLATEDKGGEFWEWCEKQVASYT